MKNVLVINGHQYYENVAEGNLTRTVITAMESYLIAKGHQVKTTTIDKGYDVAEELEKLSWADAVIFQYPVYWMGVPWITKKYLDEVCSGGAGTVTYLSDGRSRTAPSAYGTGGLLKGKSYMLSLTYNCPADQFDNPNGFFDGLSMDQANIATHKTFQFCGLSPLKSFSIHDIYKGDMQIEAELARLEKTLQENLQ